MPTADSHFKGILVPELPWHRDTEQPQPNPANDED